MRKLSIYRKYIGQAGILLLIVMFPITIFAEVIDVRIQGFDDGVRSTKQQDYEEAVLSAKRKAIESKSGAVLLSEYQIVDIGYLENRKYSIILIGKIQIQDKKGEIDTDGFYDTKWGMSVSQVREKFNLLFTTPSVEVRSTQNGDETDLTAVETKNILGCTVGNGFVFRFRNDELHMVKYHEQHPLAPWHPNFTGGEKATVTCGALLSSRYKREVNSLYKKYGQPTKNEEYNKIWVLPSTTIETHFIMIEGKTLDMYSFFLQYEKR